MQYRKPLGLAALSLLAAPAFGYAGFDAHASGLLKWGDSWFGWLTISLVVIAAITCVVAVVGWARRREARRRGMRRHSAMDALMGRFVRGEIGRAEFDQRRRQLLGS